jgi:catechol 2,3-dioxygenase-like lactoylglutathione lyase family enzyme
MPDESTKWSSRSALISVSNLDRSVKFYQAVMQFEEVLRDEQIAILRSHGTRPYALYLRQALRGASRVGQESLGARALGFDVESLADLDKVEERLRAANAFKDRQGMPNHEKFEVIRGHDPDRFPVSFVADESNTELSLEDDAFVISLMYAIDL